MSFIATNIYYYYNKKPDSRVFRKIMFSEKTLLSQVAFMVSDFFSVKPFHGFVFWQDDFKLDSKTFAHFMPLKKKQYTLGSYLSDPLFVMIESGIPHSFMLEKVEILESYQLPCPNIIEGKGTISSLL